MYDNVFCDVSIYNFKDLNILVHITYILVSYIHSYTYVNSYVSFWLKLLEIPQAYVPDYMGNTVINSQC